MADDTLQSEIERLKAENERLKSDRGRTGSLKVSAKGGVSVYGLGRFPITLYKEKWTTLLSMTDEIRAFWGIHLTGVRFDVVGHEPLSAGARGFRVGELAVAHESGALPGPHRQLSTLESPANAAAGTWVPAEVGAASGEPPVDKHGVGQLRLHGYPSRAFIKEHEAELKSKAEA